MERVSRYQASRIWVISIFIGLPAVVFAKIIDVLLLVKVNPSGVSIYFCYLFLHVLIGTIYIVLGMKMWRLFLRGT